MVLIPFSSSSPLIFSLIFPLIYLYGGFYLSLPTVTLQFSFFPRITLAHLTHKHCPFKPFHTSLPSSTPPFKPPLYLFPLISTSLPRSSKPSFCSRISFSGRHLHLSDLQGTIISFSNNGKELRRAENCVPLVLQRKWEVMDGFRDERRD